MFVRNKSNKFNVGINKKKCYISEGCLAKRI